MVECHHSNAHAGFSVGVDRDGYERCRFHWFKPVDGNSEKGVKQRTHQRQRASCILCPAAGSPAVTDQQ
jgi:hypothetical protein